MKRHKVHRPSTYARARLIRQIAAEHYEPGNQRRSYHAVWRRYIRPVYGCCYITFLFYLHLPDPQEAQPEKEDPRQLRLFE